MRNVAIYCCLEQTICIIENNDTMCHLAGRGLSLALDRSVASADRPSRPWSLARAGQVCYWCWSS